jgi:GTP-binding protein LepA
VYALQVRNIGDAPVGDTITHASGGAAPAAQALPGYVESKPVVWCGLFPIDPSQFPALRSALEKLQLTDASLQFEADQSAAMGTGFRCGFLGLLHASTIQERLEEDYGLSLIASAPSVSYKVLGDGEKKWKLMSNPAAIPDGKVKIQEPYATVTLLCQPRHVGALMELTQSGRRGELLGEEYLGVDRVRLSYSMPLSELVADYHDAIKSVSKGFATMDYSIAGFRENSLARMDILVASERVDGLTTIVHRDAAQKQAAVIVRTLKNRIPPQLFKIAIQAVIGGKIVASEHITPMRKDVTAKCYGGDVSRKKKLLSKQMEGKKRMKLHGHGRVQIPQDAYMAVVARSDAPNS